ncbi:hypothetical protein HDF10_003719 [Edaphobacter lichenicola]|uniref:Uncharacterized protein n=1 Tax=Tunturiibacter lichenicola TaxID=2051959 RepID=A0A7W8JB35_9BACT|nr:hypothetical protein [Edaphobacter lichenicola]
MARPVAMVGGVYERVPGSGLYHARYRKDGKLVRKSFKRDRAAAIAWVEKARTLKRDGGADVPTLAKLPIRTAAEVAADKIAAAKEAAKTAEVLLGDLSGSSTRSGAGPTSTRTCATLRSVSSASRRHSALDRRGT